MVIFKDMDNISENIDVCSLGYKIYQRSEMG